jgi:hypothetical protein
MTASVYAQETTLMPYHLPAPQGWGKETIPLPPEFAPDMKWHGTEELRFAPNFLKPDSATFFSYALLFWLPDSVRVDSATLRSELLVYYQGLAKAVSEGKEQTIDVATFTMTVKDAATKHETRANGQAVTAFDGELKWIEPFTTGKAQTIHMEIHAWHEAKQKSHCVFICASPQPETAAVWKSMREIREGTAPQKAILPESETER